MRTDAIIDPEVDPVIYIRTPWGVFRFLLTRTDFEEAPPNMAHSIPRLRGGFDIDVREIGVTMHGKTVGEPVPKRDFKENPDA